MISSKIKIYYEKAVDVVFGIILLFVIIAIGIGAIQLFFDVWQLLKLEGITGHYIDLISDVLTLYVLVELSRSLVEYFETHKLRLTFIVDAAIVFILREFLIGLFKHTMKPDMIYAFAAILLVLGIIRTATVLVHQQEKKITGLD